MQKTGSTLADGREIIYYDRGPISRRPAPDTRRLPAAKRDSWRRLDATTGEWIIVAGHRQDRTFQPTVGDCPLCPTRDGRLTEVPEPDYDVVVFENRFPALSGPPTTIDGGPLMASSTANGRCEVISFSSDHDLTMAELKPEQMRLVLDVWVDRTRSLAALPGVAQVFCFENRGAEMGVTLPHPHGQIYAYPYVTPRTSRMVVQAAEYRRAYGGNLFEDLVAAELANGTRVIATNDEWVAFVPFAARWPYEVHLYPRIRRGDLTGLDESQRDAFAGIYLDVLARFDRLFASPTPYVSAWHQAPTGNDELAVHLELFTNRRSVDRSKVLGGTEVAMDAFSNDVGPEPAAERLRELAVGDRPAPLS
jgi:UDPglucose--hexose-1-phosphate uridylyltransferase